MERLSLTFAISLCLADTDLLAGTMSAPGRDAPTASTAGAAAGGGVSSSVPPAKRSKQAHSSAAVHVSDDAPFTAHLTHSTFFAAPSACACGLAIGSARILVCGDGDLSYSVGLVRHLVSEAHRERPNEHADQEFTFDNFTSEVDARALRAASGSALVAELTAEQRHRAGDLQLTCTTYEEIDALSARYAEAHANAELLRSWGIKVLHGVDARRLHEYSNLTPHSTARGIVVEPDPSTVASTATRTSIQLASTSRPDWSFLHRFHHVVFHFPHVGGKSRIHLNRALLTEFLQSAAQTIVRPNDLRVRRGQLQAESDTRPGCVHVSLIRGQGGTPCDTRQRPNYGDHWQLLECGTKAGLVLTHVFPFVDALYPAYNNRGFRSRNEEFFWRGVAITHVLTPGGMDADVPEDQPSVASSSSSSSSTHREHHFPLLQAVQTAIQQHLLPHHEATAPSKVLLVAGFTRQPFTREHIERAVIRSENAPGREQIATEGSSSTAVEPSPSHATASSGAPVLPSRPSPFRLDLLVRPLEDLLSATGRSASSMVVAEVVDTGAHLDSLQWNLEPLQSAAADMEAELPLPIAVQLKRQQAPDAAVPFMHGGIPRQDHMLIVQRFARSTAAATPTSDADLLAPDVLVAAALEQDLIATVTDCLSVSLQLRHEIRVVAVPGSAVRLQPAGGAGAPPREVVFKHQVQIRYHDVWHIVGLVGSFSFPGDIGWVCQLSLDKLSLLCFDLADPRLVRSTDVRIRHQLPRRSHGVDEPQLFQPILPFSLHPLSYVRDFSFWLQPNTKSSTGGADSQSPSKSPIGLTPAAAYDAFVRLAFRLFGVACCSIAPTDHFVHPQRGPAMRIRCIFNSPEAALAPQRVLEMQEQMKHQMEATTGVEMR